MSAAEFRNQVLAGLRGDLSQFSLDQLARESGASPEEVATATKQIFAKYVARLIEDGDYTPAEQARAASLAGMLKLSAEDVTSVETAAKEKRYRREQLVAEADGVVTDVEEESLYQMRVGLGLPVTPVQTPSASDPVSTVTERNPATPLQQATGAQPFVEARLRSTLRFESLNTPGALRFELDRLKELDKTAEEKKSVWMVCCVAAGLLAAGLTLISIALFQNAGMLLVIPACIAVAGFIFSIVKYVGTAKLDVEDRRYLIAQAIVHNLSADMGENDLVGLEIDFSNYQDGELKGTEGGGFMSSEKAMSYALPWLQMKGRLVDGTRFRLGVTQCVKRKERSKRKYTKVKEAFSEKLTVTLAVKPRLQPHLAQAAAMLKARGRLNGLTLRQVSTDGKVLTVQAMTPRLATIHGRYRVTNENAAIRTCNHHTVLGLLLACYDAIGRAKSGQAA